MERLLRAPSRAATELCRYLLVSSLLLMRLCVITAEECDEIAKTGGMSVVQAFFSSKIEMHQQCEDLRRNLTQDCSESCNVAIEQFLENNGGELGRVFFSCECSEDSAMYTPEECEIDREKLVICPALYFMLQTDDLLTSTEAQEDTSPSKAPTTKEMPSTKPIIPPGKSCRKARHDCQKTLPCSKAFFTVKDFCLDDFTDGAQCSIDCRKAIDELDMFPAAEGLWGCGCDPDSDETTWCHMYGRQGLQKTCEGVKYKELNAAKTQENKDFKSDDPENSSKHHVISIFNCLLIPVLILIVVF
ncbi:hypothetical protein HOLleu_29234 [Holothuria leucospilota]|uniref:Uncharacterized protein n=1 Tax=Holothuria leucospilota TaxID=206669 RepID=A0A9Q1H171_HOLLE|nr:hypothetical protein HOLleu_29234 [Holothuria leucospilota]